MGQQQLLLLILGVIIVGIAIAVGVSQFSANNIQSNKDGITASLLNVGANAYQYRLRPSTLGGGSNSFANYAIPSKMLTDDYGSYSISSAGTSAQIVFQGKSSFDVSWVATCTVDSLGKTSIGYTGW